MAEKSGPLKGLTVIEFAHVMAGPVCGLMLADMGADVIKIEKVPGGDDTRRMGPPDIGDTAAAFMMMNRNKRGIALDLKSAGGRDVARRLLQTADVTIENYRQGTMEKLGLGYDALAADNPGLVYCEISGFGRTGPYAGRGGFDLVAQGMSGLMSVTGEGPGRAPVKVGPPVSDITAGILGAMGILAALQERSRTGRGQRVDTSLFEAAITHTYWQSAIAMATGTPPVPMGSAHPMSAPYQAFETAEGWLVLGAANQNTWLRLMEVIAVPAIAEDSRFADNAARMANLDALVEALNAVFRQGSRDDWLTRLEAAGVPAGPVNDIAEMHADPQVLARGMVVEPEHHRLGPVATIGLPVKFSNSPGAVAFGAPDYGQHTREVLAEYGYDAAAIDELVSAGAVVAADPTD